MSAPHVFFIRGLSTYGHDHAKWSWFDFGPIYQHFGRALVERGVRFFPITGLGAGSLPELAARAESFLDQHPVWNDERVPVHLVGHSAGGLLLRLLLPRLRRQPLSALTIASPHRGSALAEIVARLPDRHPGSARFLRTLGYDVSVRKHFFDELTAEGLRGVFGERFGENLSPVGDTERAIASTDGTPAVASLKSNRSITTPRLGSIVCSAPRSEWCLPLKAFHQIKAFHEFSLPSDGVVERDTQAFGDVIAELKIDHFRQMGLFGGGRAFEQLADVTADFLRVT